MVLKLKYKKQIEVHDTSENVNKWSSRAHNTVKMAKRCSLVNKNTR